MNELEIIQEMREKLTRNKKAYNIDTYYMEQCLDRLIEARKDTYKRICQALDREIVGDIFRIQSGKADTVASVGTDAIKDILFREMGFTPDDGPEVN